MEHVLTHVKSSFLQLSAAVRMMMALYPVISMQPRPVINPADRFLATQKLISLIHVGN
jgi:hypothetical protein